MHATANWGGLLALMLRRDRWWLPVWVVSAVVFCVFLVPLMPQLAGTPEKLTALAQMAGDPATVAMCGVLYGTSVGALYSQMMMVWSGMLVAVMSILVVARHTAAEEESGRTEVVRSLPTGRLATPLAAGVLVAAMNIAVAVLTGLGMAWFRVDSMTLGGCLVYGAAIGACGLLFGALALLVAQWQCSSRLVTGISLTVMSVAYVVRAYGDLSSEVASKISPLGLMQRTYPFERDQTWPVWVLLGVSACLAVLAFWRALGRDISASPLVRQRLGRSSKLRGGQFGLIWHLTRGPVIAWVVTVLLLSAGYGSVMNQMESFVMSNPLYQQLMGASGTADIMGPVVVMLLLITSMMAVIPVLTTVFQLGAEEQAGRLDLVLGRAVPRQGLFAWFAAMAAIVVLAMQVASAIGFWGATHLVMDAPLPVRWIFGCAINYGAALVAFGGLGLLLAGYAKRLAWIAWAYLVASFLVVYLGGMVNLPAWAAKLSPFGLLPRWPGQPFNWWAWGGLVAGGVVLGVVGARGFRSRDITQ